MNHDGKAALDFARKWLRRSPGPDSWSNLAAVYATMDPPDARRARQWYRRAALRNHDRALFEYGLMLIQGEGGPKVPAHGRRLLERAAARGQIDALKVLGFALSKGGYGYRPSRSRATFMNAALRRARSRLRRDIGHRTRERQR
jgi:TPR repeat protein